MLDRQSRLQSVKDQAFLDRSKSSKEQLRLIHLHLPSWPIQPGCHQIPRLTRAVLIVNSRREMSSSVIYEDDWQKPRDASRSWRNSRRPRGWLKVTKNFLWIMTNDKSPIQSILFFVSTKTKKPSKRSVRPLSSCSNTTAPSHSARSSTTPTSQVLAWYWFTATIQISTCLRNATSMLQPW